MLCALTAVLVGMHGGYLHKACVYRCPRDVSYFYYRYPRIVRVPYDFRCPPYAKVGEKV
jgi:hypothetical protein